MRLLKWGIPIFAVTLAAMAAGAQVSPDAATEKQRLIEIGRTHATALGLVSVVAGAKRRRTTTAVVRSVAGLDGPLVAGPRCICTVSARGRRIAPIHAQGAAHARRGARTHGAGATSTTKASATAARPVFPRWLIIPFLREFIVRPEQTWLTSETVNNVRRIYTDGRDHPDEAERYPLYYGDSIGFWDEGKLVIHTNQLMARYMGRNNLYQSDAIETVEIWETVAEDRIEVDAWIYDPSILEEPWHTRVIYNRVSNPDRSLRVRYWHCTENPNNEVYETEEGGTQFREFLFEE